MSRYRHAVTALGDRGFGYVIYEGNKVRLTSGAFKNREDADRVGKHFASDNDLFNK